MTPVEEVTKMELNKPTQTAKQKKQWKDLSHKEKTVATITLVFIGLVILGFIGSATGGSSNTNASKTTQQTQNQPAAKITTSQITATQDIPFDTTTKDDSSLPQGQTKTIQTGKNGTATVTYEVTYSNGTEVSRKVLSQVTTTAPVNAIVSNGTYVAPLLDISGNGIKSTQKFTTSDNWSITYTYDCSNFGQQGNFQIYINNTDGSTNADAGANDLAMSGGTTDNYYDAGEHYLEVNSECKWHVTVKND